MVFSINKTKKREAKMMKKRMWLIKLEFYVVAAANLMIHVDAEDSFDVFISISCGLREYTIYVIYKNNSKKQTHIA